MYCKQCKTKIEKDSIYIINKYGETFEIVIDSLKISEYWYDEIMITVSML